MNYKNVGPLSAGYVCTIERGFAGFRASRIFYVLQPLNLTSAAVPLAMVVEGYVADGITVVGIARQDFSAFELNRMGITMPQIPWSKEETHEGRSIVADDWNLRSLHDAINVSFWHDEGSRTLGTPLGYLYEEFSDGTYRAETPVEVPDEEFRKYGLRVGLNRAEAEPLLTELATDLAGEYFSLGYVKVCRPTTRRLRR